MSRIVYTEDREVQPQHCDVQDHMNNVVYVQWIQEVAIAAYRSKGYCREFDEKNNIIWFVRRHEIDYLAPAFVGETIRLTTWVDRGTLSTFFRRVEFLRVADQKMLCRSLTEWCYFDANRKRPAKIPDDIKADFLSIEALQ